MRIADSSQQNNSQTNLGEIHVLQDQPQKLRVHREEIAQATPLGALCGRHLPDDRCGRKPRDG
ncbi:MAG: hypothetical protein KGJ75_17950, partial [Alphaproteobacteria bacterium]|nr:hypothetical protein [Alphaproteobacteria bacterium]